jgi:hypothetical protein
LREEERVWYFGDFFLVQVHEMKKMEKLKYFRCFKANKIVDDFLTRRHGA